MLHVSAYNSTTTAQDNPGEARESGSRTKEREKEKREGDQAVVKLRVECLLTFQSGNSYRNTAEMDYCVEYCMAVWKISEQKLLQHEKHFYVVCCLS